MEPSDLEIKLKSENFNVLQSVLPRFNSIYKRHIEIEIEKEEVIVLSKIENVTPNDIFTLGGFYGTALFKNKKNS